MPPSALTVQLLSSLRDHTSLIARACKFIGARESAAVAASDRGGAVRRPAGDLVELHLACEAVVEPDHNHAEMKQVGDDREQGGLLAAVLGGCRGKRTTDFAVQRAFHPQAAGLIEKIRHLRGNAAEARAGPDNDSVVVRKLIDLRDRGGLIELVVSGLCDL